MIIELGDITLEERTNLFRLWPLPIFPYEKNDDVWISITVERDLSLKTLNRGIYTSFDFLSDIGGLYGILAGLIGIFVSMWNINMFDNMMVRQLYRMWPAPKKDGINVRRK